MAELQIKIGASIEGLKQSISQAEKQLQDFSKQAVSIGKSLSLAVTAPLTGLAALGVRNFDRQVQAIGQIETALLSTGNAAGKTSEQLQKTASDLQSISTFGDEEILQKVTAQLLTFTNIAGDAFDRTQKAALDLATRLGGDLQGASIQLGKALNDPVANLSALSRSGIQFSAAQKELINSLVETNQLAEAQNIILDELEKQYGGSAEAAAKLGLGPLKQLSNQFGDLLEDVGEIILNGLTPLIAKVSDVITFFQGLSDSTKQTIVIIGGLVAGLGPLLIALGSLAQLLPVLKIGLAALTGPIGLITLAIGAAIPLLVQLNTELERTSKIAGEVRAAQLEENFKNIREEVETLAKRFQEIDPSLTPLEATNKAVDRVKESYTQLLISQQKSGNINVGLIKDQINFLNEFKTEINTAKTATGELASSAKLTFEEFSKLADIANQKVFSKFAEDAKIFNAELNETIRLQRAIESLSQNIVSGFQIKDILVDIGETAPIQEIADELENVSKKVLLLGNDFQILGATIGNSLSGAVGAFGPFLSQFLSFAGKLIDSNFKIATSSSIAAASSSAAATGPGAIFTLPAFIASAVGLIATAFSGIRRSSGGISAGGSVASPQGQTISGTGLGFSDPNREIKLVAEVEGSKLRYVIDQSGFYSN